MFETGKQYEFNNRIFTYTGSEPYTRKDGGVISLLVFERHCNRCGHAYTVKVSEKSLGSTNSFYTNHCPECAKLLRKKGLK